MKSLRRWLWLPPIRGQGPGARRLGAAASFCALVTLVATRVPLFNLLGYEYCLALNLAVAPWAVALGVGVGSAGGPGRRLWPLLQQAWMRAATALLPALCLMLSNALWVKNCNFAAGLGFFAGLPFASACYGATLGLALAALLQGARPAVGVLAATLLPLAYALMRLYALPPINAYSHLWGYFAGSLYDETVSLDARFAWFRAATALRVAAAAGFVAWTHRHPRPWRQRAAVAAAGVSLALAVDLGPGARLGYATDRAQLARVLPQVRAADGLVLHLPAALSEREAQLLLRDHGFRLSQLQQRLDLPASRTPVHSWVFATAADKAYWTGGNGTMVAKAWLQEIYLHGTAAPHPLVAHELVHAAAAPWGRPPLAGPWRGALVPNVGLIEGLAEAVAFRDRAQPLRLSAAALWPTGTAARLLAAMGGPTAAGAPAFWAQAGPRAYAEAGAFVAYLLQTYGAQAVASAYRDGDLARAFARPLQQLVADFGVALTQVQPTAAQSQQVRDAFASESIFARTCAHEVAALRQAQVGATPQQALVLQRQVASYLPGSTQEQLALAVRLLEAGDAAAASEAAGLTARLRPNNVYLAAEVHEALAAAYGRNLQQAAALAEVEAGLQLHLGGALDRALWVRRWAIGLPAAPGAAVAALLRGGSNPWLAASTLASPPLADDLTARYLLGRQLWLQGEQAAAVFWLRRSGPHPFAAIEAERLRLLLTHAWQQLVWGPPATEAQHQQNAADLRALAAQQMPDASQRWAADMRERLAWEAGAVPAATLPP